MSDTQSNILNNSYAKKNFEFKQNTQELSQSRDNSALAKFFKNSNDQDSMIKSRKQRLSLAQQDGVNSAFMSLYEDQKVKNTQMSKVYKAFKQSEIKKPDNFSKLQNNGSQFQKAHQIWIKNFFKIIILVNRLVFKTKQRLIFFRPNTLQQRQIDAINDQASQLNSVHEQLEIKNITRSRYKCVRKLRIFLLLARKQFKNQIQMIKTINHQISNFFLKLKNPIPVILPYYQSLLIWELFLVIFIFINVIKIPYEISFLQGNFFEHNLSFVSRVVFGLNTLIIMNTAYYENGIIQENRSSIMLHFMKYHLAVEFITNSCLWFNPFGIQILRVLFMLKVITFYDIIEKFTESVQFSPKYNLCIKLATLLVEVIILCHIFACIWYSLGLYQENNGIYQNWLRSQNLEDQLVRTKYISSLYFSVVTIGTIGYGDILPQNEIERGVLAGMAIMTCGIFAYILSNIQNVYRKYNQKQKAYIKSLTDLNNFMTNRSVNPILQQMARKYLKYIHDQNFRKGEVPCESLNVLSKHLREEITSEIFNKTINQIKFFKQFSQQLKQQLAQRMTEYTYGPDEIIFKMNSLQEPQIIFVLKGSIEISIEQGKYFKFNKEKQKEPFHTCKPNQTIGEYEFVSQSQVSSFNAKSIGITTTHQLKLSEFLEILKQYSNDRETYQQLKDSLNLYERYSICNIYCYSCKSSKHLTNECPVFFYKPNKLRIINLQNKIEENNIKNFHRSKNRLKFSSLLYQKGIAITSLAYKQENQDEMSFFSSMKSLEENQDDKKINTIQQTKSQKIISNCEEGAFENISSQEILAPKKDQDLKIFTETSTSQLNLKDNLSEIKISFLELQIEKQQNKSQFMSIHKKLKDIDEYKKIDEEKSEINSKLAEIQKKAQKRRTNLTSQLFPFQAKNFSNQQNQNEEVLEDDLITETMRSYTRYMIHNNIEVILRKIRIQGFKGKEKTKKINFSK
ncbi:hypothetical protein ABPG72_006818 [Tetrahymena utriculariae]